MSWLYPIYGTTGGDGGFGFAVITPLALDLAMIVDTFNGHWDRDNVGPAHITTASTLESPFTSAIQYTADSAGTAFTIAYDGRHYHTDVDQTVTCPDCELVCTAMTSLLIASNSYPTPDEMKLRVGCGIEVDGHVVYHSSFDTVRYLTTAMDLGFPRITVGVPVGAGTHKVRLFFDFLFGTPSAAAANIHLNQMGVRESILIVEQVRR